MKAILALLVLTAAPAGAIAEDACSSLVPANLQSLLFSKFGGYRLPRETDNLAEDVQYARTHGGSPCLGVSAGDFDGSGQLDFIIALTAKTGPGAIVVAAFARSSGWKTYTLDVWKDDRSRLIVTSAPAGTYDDVGDYEKPRENGAVDHLVCPHSVAAFGQSESSEIVYCFLKSGWKHVWVSD